MEYIEWGQNVKFEAIPCRIGRVIDMHGWN